MVIVNCKQIKKLSCCCPHWFTAMSFEQVQLRLLQHLCTSFLYQIKCLKQVGDMVIKLHTQSTAAPQAVSMEKGEELSQAQKEYV